MRQPSLTTAGPRAARRRATRRGERVIERDRRAWAWTALIAWTLLLTAILTEPLIHSGYLLGHDLVFTPQQPLGLDAVGLGSAAPRAVPLDALVALVEKFLDGAVVGRLANVVPLVGAGLGAAFLLRRQPPIARAAAATAAVWNPFVVERLALGQWALLWSYAALPWLVHAVTVLRGRGGRAARAVALAAASITPTGGVIASLSAAALSLHRPRRERLATIGLAVVLQLPWVVPAALSPASSTSDPAGVRAFAARGEHPGGALVSLLGGGGIWDSDVMPASRGGALPWLWLATLAAAAAYGYPRVRAALGAKALRALVCVAAAGFLIAALPSLPGGAALTRAAIEHLPGAGLLRDAQKWVLPLVLLEALLVGAAAARSAERLATGLHWRYLLGIAVLVLPLIALPDAAATLRPTLTPVHYPADWTAVADRLVGTGDVAVLPWQSYRRFPWVSATSVLDPAPRLLPAATVVDDRLSVGGRLLRGENPRAEQVRRALAAGPNLPDRLAQAGIGWVVVEHRTPGTVPDLSGLERRYTGRDVSLYRVPGSVASMHPGPARVTAVVVADATAALAVLGSVVWGLVNRRRRRETNGPTGQ